MTLIYLLAIAAGIWCVVRIIRRARDSSGNSGSGRPAGGYPYRPDVETRLPNGRITTNGYAARNPEQFSHWCYGPENICGEYIDRQDWEEWRSNYYGD